MNKYIDQLCAAAAKESRVILGMMSGTSLDGLDLALCRIHHHGLQTKVELLHHRTLPYTEAQKNMIREVAFKPEAMLDKICLLHAWVADVHAGMVIEALQDWQFPVSSVDLLASHGQTVFHAPDHSGRLSNPAHSTLQMGDGDRLAVKTGIICISDFRQKHIAAGGEGAPLAAYGDFLLFAENDCDVLLINIGGISNLTYIPAGRHFNRVVSGDTGPGNKIMDTYIQSLPGERSYDKDGQLASGGQIHDGLLAALKADPYFNRPLPKTTGPELFNLSYLRKALNQTECLELPAADIMATLNRFTADTICDAVLNLPVSNKRKYMITGGGAHNHVLMKQLQKQLYGTRMEAPFSTDAKEAILFAILANQCVAGNGTDFGEPAPNLPATGMGKISLPA